MRHKKKILFLLLAAIFVIIFSGCGAIQESADTKDVSESVTVSTTEEGSTDDTEGYDIDSVDDEKADDSSEIETIPSDTETESQEDTIMIITVNGTELTATMKENSSVVALMELLLDGPLTIEMSDYGNMEKVGSLGTNLPRNDEQTTTEAGDLILYQGNSFVMYYSTNSWSFTRLGKIQGITSAELKELLGDGDVSVTLSLPDQQ